MSRPEDAMRLGGRGVGLDGVRMSAPRLWAGVVLSAIPVLVLVLSAGMIFTGNAQLVDEFVNRFGYPASVAPVLGAIELACAILYAIPRTAVLGAILLTGYLGGAVATHVRIGDPAY